MIDALVAFALLASAITANKIVLCVIPATFFVALRMLAAGILLIGYHWYTATLAPFNQIKKDILNLMAIAAAVTFITSFLKAYALRGMISSKAALIGSLDPFVTACYTYLLFNEKYSSRQWLGIVLGFIGAVIVLLQNCPGAGWLSISYPELAAFAAVCISRFGWIEAQKLLKKDAYSPSNLNGLLMIIGGIYALISAFYLSEITTALHWSWPVIIALAYTIIIGNVVAYSLYGYLLKRHSAMYVSLAGLLIPLFVHFFGPIVIGEPLSAVFFVALGCMFVGLWLFSGKTAIQS